MHPLGLLLALEQSDPSFRDLFYPKALRCPLDDRIVAAIEQHWPAYFPTRKECRGSSWTLTIPEDEPLYQPQPKSKQKLEQWKKRIAGTIAEIRAYNADISWKRFIALCRSIRRLWPLLKEFEPLTNFLIREESMWPTYGGVPVGEKQYFNDTIEAVFNPKTPYRLSESDRSRLLKPKSPMIEKVRSIRLRCELFEWPLLTLAILQRCASKSRYSRFWLPIDDHIKAIVKRPLGTTFRQTWFDHAMQVSGAIKRNGQSCPRKWARMLLSDIDADLTSINSKAIEVNSWLKGKKQPSVANIERIGQVLFAPKKAITGMLRIEGDLWIFSWMITLWLEKHFTEIYAELNGDPAKIRTYYRRFFHHERSHHA